MEPLKCGLTALFLLGCHEYGLQASPLGSDKLDLAQASGKVNGFGCISPNTGHAAETQR